MAVQKELAFALWVFARTARSLPLYSPNNQQRAKMMAELDRAFTRLFEGVDEVKLSVRPDAFFYEELAVLEEANVEPSVPYLFFRDGVRRLELSRGLNNRELEILVAATAQGLSRRGLDDDIISILWRHQLEHVRYVTVDTTVVGAAAGEPDPTGDVDMDAQINSLIHSIYGSSSNELWKGSLHVDNSDLSAKGIAEALGSIDEMASGFFPPQRLLSPPVYAERVVKEVAEETDATVMELAASAAAEGLARTQDPTDASAFSSALLAIFDAALLEEHIVLLKRIMAWVQPLAEKNEKARDLLSAMFSEARVRQLAALGNSDTRREAEVMSFLKSCGRALVPALVGLLPSLTDPRQRRAFSDLALEMGTEDVEPIVQLLHSEQGFVAAEALHMLAQMRRLDRYTARAAITHPKPQVRLTVLQMTQSMERDVAEDVVVDLLDDREPRVRMEAVKLIGGFDGPRARAAIESTIAREEFEEASPPVKEAFLKAYVGLAGRHSFERLDELIRATDRRLARKQVEELGAAAVIAIASLPSSRSVEILKNACLSKNKRVRELARAELKKMREDLE